MTSFISGLALILFTLVGYSSGSVLVSRGRRVSPGLVDLAITLGLWIGALASRDVLGKWWAFLVWLVAGGITGVCVVLLRTIRLPSRKLKQSTSDVHPINEITTINRLLQQWKVFAEKLGNFQGRILLTWFYFVVVTPFGILVRLLSDPLKMRRENTNSSWLARPVEYPDLDDARRQY